MRALITGGAGFIGSHVVKYLLEETDWQLTLIDRLDISGNLNRLAQVGAAKNPRVKFIYHDLKAPIANQVPREYYHHIVHLAASTHVDRSITDPLSFVYDNVVATCNMLNYAREVGCGRFLYFSTDEVFGAAPVGVAYREWDRYKSTNPYSATKAGGEELAIAFHNTYAVPTLITHTMNVFGPMQHSEKFIPSTIRKVRDGEKIHIHSNPERTKAGSRFYIHAAHVASAVKFVLEHGVPGDKYNIVGEREVDNEDLARTIAFLMGKGIDYELTGDGNRPGHDLRYALDGGKLAAMGWSPPYTFQRSLYDTVQWTLGHPEWL